MCRLRKFFQRRIARVDRLAEDFAMYRYRAFGVSIESDLACPELREDASGCVDLVIEGGSVSAIEPVERFLAFGIEASKVSLTFEVPGVGRFLARDGTLIRFEAESMATQDDIRLYLLGSALGAALMQRGLLGLHGSAVVVDGRAVAFLGESGIGKSTLAAALVSRGLPLLTDDLCMVSTSGCLEVQSGYPQNKLWLDSLAELELAPRGLRKVRPGFDKRALPVDAQRFCVDACPLERIYVLSRSDSGDADLARLTGPSKLAALLVCRYRPGFAEGMGLAATQFQQLAKVARGVEIGLLARASERFALADTVELVMRDLGL